MREYYSRVLAYIACGASIAAGTYTQYFSYGILWMVPYALLYPHLAYHLGQRFRQHDPRKVTRRWTPCTAAWAWRCSASPWCPA